MEMVAPLDAHWALQMPATFFSIASVTLQQVLVAFRPGGTKYFDEFLVLGLIVLAQGTDTKHVKT